MTRPDPQWLVHYVNQAWEATYVDLEPLSTALIPHYDRFVAIYQSITHKYFAHRATESSQSIEALFSQTNKADVNEILEFLYTMLEDIREMTWNASRFDLTNSAASQVYMKSLDKHIEKFIR